MNNQSMMMAIVYYFEQCGIKVFVKKREYEFTVSARIPHESAPPFTISFVLRSSSSITVYIPVVRTAVTNRDTYETLQETCNYLNLMESPLKFVMTREDEGSKMNILICSTIIHTDIHTIGEYLYEMYMEAASFLSDAFEIIKLAIDKNRTIPSDSDDR